MATEGSPRTFIVLNGRSSKNMPLFRNKPHLIAPFREGQSLALEQVYRWYFERVLPLVGGLVSGNRGAYSYLPQSVGIFPQGEAFVELLEEAGFVEAEETPLTLGICSIYQGIKPGEVG